MKLVGCPRTGSLSNPLHPGVVLWSHLPLICPSCSRAMPLILSQCSPASAWHQHHAFVLPLLPS